VTADGLYAGGSLRASPAEQEQIELEEQAWTAARIAQMDDLLTVVAGCAVCRGNAFGRPSGRCPDCDCADYVRKGLRLLDTEIRPGVTRRQLLDDLEGA
jgi:hypothetical protein